MCATPTSFTATLSRVFSSFTIAILRLLFQFQGLGLLLQGPFAHLHGIYLSNCKQGALLLVLALISQLTHLYPLRAGLSSHLRSLLPSWDVTEVNAGNRERIRVVVVAIELFSRSIVHP